MPTITAFPDQADAMVRVEVNWADTPAVQYAKVLRYNPATGECVPLRPYICYDGDHLALSCGHGIFFDTEMPLDTEVYYITEGLDAPCLPADPLLLDTFTRVVVDSWGTPTIGNPYTTNGGAATDYDVNGSQGTQLNNTVNIPRIAVTDIGSADVDLYGEVTIPAIATGAPISARLLARYTDPANYYIAHLSFGLLGAATLDLRGIAGGIGMVLSASVPMTVPYAAGDRWAIHFRVAGTSLQASAWNLTALQTEPAAFQVSVTDTSLVTGSQVGASTRLDTGNTNVSVLMAWDNLRAELPCAPCEPVSVDTSLDPTTIASAGRFWIRDPVRPCNDRPVPLCFTQPTTMDADGYCVPANGIFFASMDTEVYEPNTLTLNPTNAKYPLAMSRTRRGVSSTLTLVTRTFADRDALITLAEPGSPLFWQGPAAYGIGDQYLDVGSLGVVRGLSDHKFQVRVLELPYVQVGRPAGPSQGVCGSQVGDLCDFTWSELAAAGDAWDDLIRGRSTGGVDGYRTWTIGANTVLGDFADWNAVDSGTRTWTDLEVGL